MIFAQNTKKSSWYNFTCSVPNEGRAKTSWCTPTNNITNVTMYHRSNTENISTITKNILLAASILCQHRS